MIIGVGCKARSGKDTVADYLIKKYGFKKTSMATSIKEGIGRGVFGFNDDQLYGDRKEIVDKFWDARLNIYEVLWANGEITRYPDVDGRTIVARAAHESGKDVVGATFKRLPITPRLILQIAGTEAGRNIYGYDLWVETAYRRITQSGHPHWVIPDIRFPNEANAIVKWGGSLIRVDREGAGATLGASNHASETSMNDFNDWNWIIDNSGTLRELYERVDNIIERLLYRK